MKICISLTGSLRTWTTLFALTCVAGAALAQVGFPDKPVRIIVPLSAGTGTDVVARLLGEKLAAKWGQQVVVDNRPGAGGINAVQALKQAPADGYTMLQAEAGMIAVAPHVFKKLPYDPPSDLAGVATLFRTYYMICVAGNGPIDSLPKLVSAARAAPGQLSYASTGVGSPAHLYGAVLSDAMQAPMLHAPFKDASQMFTDVSTGSVTWVWATSGSLKPFLDSKRLRVIASGSPQRLRGFEDVPTVAEQGGPKDMVVDNWNTLFTRKGAPAEIVSRINRDIAEVMALPDMRKRLSDLGYEPFPGSPADADELIASETRRYGAVVKRVNVEPQ